MTKRLLEPVLEGGIRHVHFFNGRRLTAEDLKAEQDAARRERELLGLGVGAGIVSGFEVSETADSSGDARGSAVLKVRAGVAINGLGTAIALTQDVNVALVAPESPLPAGAGLFAPCEGTAPVEIGTAAGAYILVASPASGFEGRAPLSALDSCGKATGCGSRYAVAGVRFGVVPVPLPGGSGDPGLLRNRLAHRCFGTEALLASGTGPREAPGKDGLLEAAPDLTACDVPLALLYWSDGRIRFIDAWAVRRRVTAPSPAADWISFVADARAAVGEAVFLQFQEHVDWLLRNEIGLKSMAAHARFRYLPPAGFLPVGFNEFDPAAFFRRDRFVDQVTLQADRAFLREWVHRSFYLDPIDANAPPPVAIYRIPGTADYVFFMRQDASSFDVKAPDPPSPATEVVAATGAIEVDLVLAEESVRSGAAEELAAQLATEKDAIAKLVREIRVTVADELGRVYDGDLTLPGRSAKFEIQGRLTTRKAFARVVFGPLDPGAYTAEVRSKLFRPASKHVKLPKGATERVTFELVPAKKAGSGTTGTKHIPERSARAEWMEPGWYGKIVVMEAYVNPDPLPEVTKEWDFVTDPPPHVKEWLIHWADWTAAALPGAAVDPGEPRILINPDYVPGATADEPYAYIEFGAGGANVPIVLVPSHTSLEGPVSVQTAGVEGVDLDSGMRLWQLGAGDVDVAASAWTGLLRDAGFAGESATAVISDARNKAAGLKSSVKTVPGVTSTLAAALEEKGIDTAVKLANADPARLQEELGIDRAAADAAVEEARKVVPEESWSLDASDLGISEEKVKALEESGVKTKGDLARLSADEIAEKAGLAVEEAGAIREKAAERLDAERVKTEAAERAPITVLEETAELGPQVVKNLAKSGVASLKDVANADVERLAALTGDRRKAESLVEAAKSRLGSLK